MWTKVKKKRKKRVQISENEFKVNVAYVNPVNTQSCGRSRYGCLRSSEAVGRSSGFLKVQGHISKEGYRKKNSYMAKHFLLKSSASADNTTSSGTGGCLD